MSVAAVERRTAVLVALSDKPTTTPAALAADHPGTTEPDWRRCLDDMCLVGRDGAALLYRHAYGYSLAPRGWEAMRRLTNGDTP